MPRKTPPAATASKTPVATTAPARASEPFAFPIPKSWLSAPIQIDVVGAGGNGSLFLNRLARLHQALLAYGHPTGLQVTAYDPDTVSTANLGRQAFYAADVGMPKAVALINRINLAYGYRWKAVPAAYPATTSNADLVVSCVDTKSARAAIATMLKQPRFSGTRLYLDIGNRMNTGQFILGQPPGATADEWRLPCSHELYPEMIGGREDDDTPSCSMREALTRQSLMINDVLTAMAIALLDTLFKSGRITHHGVFVNLETGHTTPMPCDRALWARIRNTAWQAATTPPPGVMVPRAA